MKEIDNAMETLWDELAQYDLTDAQQLAMGAGLANPDVVLDFADWLALNRDANRREKIAEKHRLMKARQEYQISLKQSLPRMRVRLLLLPEHAPVRDS